MITTELANDLMSLANELLKHEPVEIGDCTPRLYISMYSYDNKDIKNYFINLIKSIGNFTKRFDDDKLECFKVIGKLELNARINRDIVCNRIKVIKEVDDWECEPLFKQGEI